MISRLPGRIPWPLLAILGVQATLSARLLRANTAFIDEATYLYAGHQEWNHWIHGSSVAAYATYFSGAPTIYPPLGALADTLGGLTGARILSLVFMLLATCMLYATTGRLFGRWAAFSACAVFVSLGSTQALGAFATYDAMAFSILTVAVYCAVRAAQSSESTRWWVAAAALMALANATKYATGLYDPFILMIVALLAYRRYPLRAVVRRCAAALAVTIAVIAAALAAGGIYYYDGIAYTTVERTPDNASALNVASHAWSWIGWAVLCGACAPMIALWRRDRRTAALTALLVCAGCAAPLNQIRIHTIVSLQKHVDFGAWFACIALGYAVSTLSGLTLSRWIRAPFAVLLAMGALALTAPAGYAQSRAYFHGWSDRTLLAKGLAPYVRPGADQYLVEDRDLAAYYLQGAANWSQWRDTRGFSYYDKRAHRVVKGSDAYVAAVRAHYFSLIALDFGGTSSDDRLITATMAACPDHCGYRVITTISHVSTGHSSWKYTVWQYQGGAS